MYMFRRFYHYQRRWEYWTSPFLNAITVFQNALRSHFKCQFHNIFPAYGPGPSCKVRREGQIDPSILYSLVYAILHHPFCCNYHDVYKTSHVPMASRGNPFISLWRIKLLRSNVVYSLLHFEKHLYHRL